MKLKKRGIIAISIAQIGILCIAALLFINQNSSFPFVVLEKILSAMAFYIFYKLEIFVVTHS